MYFYAHRQYSNPIFVRQYLVHSTTDGSNEAVKVTHLKIYFKLHIFLQLLEETLLVVVRKFKRELGCRRHTRMQQQQHRARSQQAQHAGGRRQLHGGFFSQRSQTRSSSDVAPARSTSGTGLFIVRRKKKISHRYETKNVIRQDLVSLLTVRNLFETVIATKHNKV